MVAIATTCQGQVDHGKLMLENYFLLTTVYVEKKAKQQQLCCNNESTPGPLYNTLHYKMAWTPTIVL